MPFNSPVPTKKVASTNNNNLDALLSGLQWQGYSSENPISFSFTSSIDDYESNYRNRESIATSFQPMSTQQQLAARAWIKIIGEVSDAKFKELSEPHELRDATLRMATTDSAQTAEATLPGTSTESGDEWFNKTDFNSPILGNYAYFTFGHELGHALGLKHGHETGGIKNLQLTSDRNSIEFSIMTYNAYIGADPKDKGKRSRGITS